MTETCRACEVEKRRLADRRIRVDELVGHTGDGDCRLSPKSAVAARDLHPVSMDWTDPEEGYRWLYLSLRPNCAWDEVLALPQVLKYDGDVFARTGWNSDDGRVFYRNGMQVAQEA